MKRFFYALALFGIDIIVMALIMFAIVGMGGSLETGFIVAFIISLPIIIYCIIKMNSVQPNSLSNKPKDNPKEKETARKSKNGVHDADVFDKYQPAVLPVAPTQAEPANNFICPSLNSVKPYFEAQWRANKEDGWVNVMYEGRIVLQIMNEPEEENGRRQNIVLGFFPYSYNYSLVNRFKTCKYYPDFAQRDSEEANYMIADYGTNISQALKVASYVLNQVYGIPSSYFLTCEYS